MKEDERITKKLYNLSIILSLLIFIDSFCPWLNYDGKGYTILGFYQAIFRSGSIMNFAASDSSIYPAVPTLILPLLAGIAAFIKAIIMLLRRGYKALSLILYGAEWAYIASYLAFMGYTPTIFAIAGTVLILVDFLLNKLMLDYKTISKQNKEMRLNAKERKERTRFRGRYSPYLYFIINKMEQSYRRELMQFIGAGIVAILFLFELFSASSLLSDVHSYEISFLGSGLQKQLKIGLQLSILSNIVLIAIAYSQYASAREYNDMLLAKLGARKKIINSTTVYTLSKCILFIFFIGFSIGTVILVGIQKYLSNVIGRDVGLNLSIGLYLKSGCIFLLIIFLVSIIQYDLHNCFKATDNQEISCKLPSKKTQRICAVLGIMVFVLAGDLFIKRRWAESMNLFMLILVGISIFIYGLAAVLIKRIIYSKQALDKLSINSFIMDYKTIIFNMTAIFILQVSMMGPLSTGICTLDINESYSSILPYDYVCMTYKEDQDVVEKLKESGCIVQTVPMVRVTSLEGDKFTWQDAANNRFMGVLWPQCQHIGVSKKGYNDLCKYLKIKPISMNLKDNQIWVIYQEDKSIQSHPIDYYLFRKKPYLRIGQPLRYYNVPDRETLYPMRTLSGESRQIITGMLNRGMQENLIVFSDEYFNSLKETDGANVCLLLDKGTADKKTVKKLLSILSKRHKEDRSWDRDIRVVYDSEIIKNNTIAENILKKGTGILSIFILLICCILIMNMHIQRVAGSWKDIDSILNKLGLSESGRNKILKKDCTKILIIIPMSMIFSIIYIIVISKLRFFELEDFKKLIIKSCAIWTPILIILFLSFIVNLRKTVANMHKGDNYNVK